MKEINLEEIAIKHGIIGGLSIYSTTDVISKKFNDYSMDLVEKVLELAAENANIESREYEVDGNYNSINLGQEIMIQEPNYYIGIDKQSILDTIKQVK